MSTEVGRSRFQKRNLARVVKVGIVRREMVLKSSRFLSETEKRIQN